jgi:uncharacterized membrane protein YphA (DoxX/SURF4 family)
MQISREIAQHRAFELNIIRTLAIIFMVSGVLKFSGHPMLSEAFVRWGYPVWFSYCVGVIELSAGLMLLSPRTLFYGGVLLSLQMFGAFFTHIVHGEAVIAVLPLGLMLLMAQIVHHNSTPIVAKMDRLLKWYELDGKRPQ